MIIRSALLLVFALSLSTVSAQSSSELLAVRATTVHRLAAPIDLSAAERTAVLLDALVHDDRTPLTESIAPHRARTASADFSRYLDAVTAGIGALRAYRIVQVQAHERAATSVLAQVEGAHGTDVLRFVWRDGKLALLNRGPRTVR